MIEPIQNDRIRNTAECHIYGRTRQNAGRGRYIGVLALAAFCALLASCSVPDHAQGNWHTPTPLPAIATAQSKAYGDLSSAKAARNDAVNKAAEILHNADNQIDDAVQAISDARAAAASQNAIAIGEAIGRADANISQLRESVVGQAEIIATLSASNADVIAMIAAQSITITQQATELGRLRTDVQNYREAYEESQAVANQAASPVVIIASGLIFVFLIGIVIIFVIEKWRNGGAKPIRTEAQIVDIVGDDEDD